VGTTSIQAVGVAIEKVEGGSVLGSFLMNRTMPFGTWPKKFDDKLTL
jgi:hypothetical protein